MILGWEGVQSGTNNVNGDLPDYLVKSLITSQGKLMNKLYNLGYRGRYTMLEDNGHLLLMTSSKTGDSVKSDRMVLVDIELERNKVLKDVEGIASLYVECMRYAIDKVSFPLKSITCDIGFVSPIEAWSGSMKPSRVEIGSYDFVFTCA